MTDSSNSLSSLALNVQPFQHCIYGDHVTNTTDTDFARDEHD